MRIDARIKKPINRVFLLSLKKLTKAENLSSSELYSAMISPKDWYIFL
jgi:hypothetical protein